ncbi:MAG: amidohydrolase family protein [Clostridiales bacterium]|nr:amidohydrolase family protein [Clostridiales bacterium]
MISALKGNIIAAPKLGELDITEKGYLVFNDGGILGVFQNLPEKYAGAEVTDFGDKLILQSFCDMHLHAPQFAMLGMGMDLPLLDWLNAYTFRTEAQFADLDYAREVYMQLAQQLVKNGTTRICMFSSVHTDATLLLMEILEQSGICGFVGKVNMDRNCPDYLAETLEQSKRETLRWLDGCARFNHIKPILTPRFTPTCSDELMAWLGQLAAERGLYVQSHMSENLAEIDWVCQLHPDCKQYWETYQKYGLFGNNTVMAHCVFSDERERAAMREHGVLVAHCADSNVNLSSGIAPVKQMLNENVRVVLGSDIAGGAQLPMLNVITMTIRASKMRRIQTGWQDNFLTVAEAYYLATTAAAQVFGAGEGFAVGDPLHAVVIDDASFAKTRPLSVRERFERGIYLADHSNICAVYSEGIRIK